MEYMAVGGRSNGSESITHTVIEQYLAVPHHLVFLLYTKAVFQEKRHGGARGIGVYAWDVLLSG